MDTEKLRSFLHVAELGSLSKAAKRLHISQPALSRQVSLLEEEVSAQLFERTGRGMALTAAGRTLASRGRALLSQLEQLQQEVAAESAQISGAVRLAIPPSLGVLLPADVVQSVRKSHPQIDVQVIIALSGAVADGLSRGDLDLGVLYASVSSPQLQTEPLYKDVLWLVGPRKAKLKEPVTLKQALLHPMILPTRRHGLRLLVEAQAAQRGLPVDVRAQIDGLRLLVELVVRGEGFSLSPRGAIEAELKAGRLTAAPVIRPKLQRTALLGRPAHRPITPAAQVLADAIKRRLSQA